MAVKPCKYGHLAGRDTQSHCLGCRRQNAKTYRIDNPNEAKTYDCIYHMVNHKKRNEDARSHYRANFKKTMLRNAQKRARQGGYACTITDDHIIVPEFCPLLGIKLQTGGKLGPSSPSLDKVVPALGYVPGNVWVISWRANALKNDATLEELELLVVNLKKRCTVYPPAGAGPQSLILPWASFATPERMPWELTG